MGVKDWSEMDERACPDDRFNIRIVSLVETVDLEVAARCACGSAVVTALEGQGLSFILTRWHRCVDDVGISVEAYQPGYRPSEYLGTLQSEVGALEPECVSGLCVSNHFHAIV